MSRLLTSPRICLAVLLCAALCEGCQPPQIPNAPGVAGKVTLDGQPVTSGQVSFVPVEAGTSSAISAGTIDANGEYKVFTAGSAGAPLGKYKITVTPSMAMMAPTGGAAPPASIPRKYGDTKTTPFTIDVVSSPEAGHYDLPLKK